MIRECFRVNTGIIFDAHMLQHEVGLDINSITQAPPRIKPEGDHLLPPEKMEHGFVTFLKGLWALVKAPAIWLVSLFRKLVVHSEPKPNPNFTAKESRFISEGEAHEELHDALSPVYDQLSAHMYWQIMEWIPWISKKQRAEINGSDDFWAYQFVYVVTFPFSRTDYA